MNSKRWLLVALMSCLVLLGATSLFGQATANASLQGTVTDKSQAVIGSKAEITLPTKRPAPPAPPTPMTRVNIALTR